MDEELAARLDRLEARIAATTGLGKPTADELLDAEARDFIRAVFDTDRRQRNLPLNNSDDADLRAFARNVFNRQPEEGDEA